ncbi:MAG: hypothetical protein KGS72_19795 [Cyanobacteria bacterium REEB67]|nr:hypothetical protein [Cyanobacteria bacterium REEB67]
MHIMAGRRTGRIKQARFSLAVALTLAIGGNIGAAQAADGQAAKLDKVAQTAFDQGDYKKADMFWSRVLTRLDQIGEKNRRDNDNNNNGNAVDMQTESAFRHLGESALKQKNYESASDFFQKAKALSACAAQDSELDRDCKELSANYRRVDLNDLGPIAKAACDKFHPDKVSVAKTDKGHHIAFTFPDDIIKDVGSKGVNQIGLEKNLAFDLLQGDGGEIILANITGLKVHATVWINIVNSSLKLDEAQRPVALVTGRKFGFTQSVSAPVPDLIYLPVLGIVSQVKSLFEQDQNMAGNGLVPVTRTIEAAPTAAASIDAMLKETAQSASAMDKITDAADHVSDVKQTAPTEPAN